MPDKAKTPPQIGSKTVKAADLKVRVPDALPSIYCNTANINGTSWDDVRFSFGEIVVIGTGEPFVEIRTTVVMTRKHAEAFAKVVRQFFPEEKQ